MYMIRLVYQCKRGKCLDVVKCLKTLNQIYTSDGCTHGKIYVDRMGRMDRAIYEFAVASLDQFYTVLQGRYANLSPDAQRLVDSLNDHAIEGVRALYKVIA